MANPTSNFGWQMPTNTDLVKDLPADFEVFGQAVDTDLADLKGGTTGQVLSKTSNTDLDFTWTTPNVGDITEVQGGTGISVASGTGPIPVITNTVATEFDAKGDLIVGTGADTFDRLAVGTDGYQLVADSLETTGLKWVASSSVSAATQAEQESASSTSVYVSPGRQQYHPSAAKFWVYFTGTSTPTIQVSYNMTSITDNGTGYYTINIATDFSSGNYVLTGGADKLSGASSDTTLTGVCFVGAYQTGDFGILTYTLNGTLVDSGRVFCIGYGDQ